MNYEQPREIRGSDGKGTGKYHWTCQNGDRIWPVGYCAEGCPGHHSPEDAAEHYRQWVIDQGFDVSTSDSQRHKCAECGEWTWDQLHLKGSGNVLFLCENHRDREIIDKHVPLVTRSIHS